MVGGAFAIWSVREFGFGGTIGVRQFAHPISAKSGFGVITSRADKLPRLTLSVRGESIAKKAFIFAHAQSRLEYDLHELQPPKLDRGAISRERKHVLAQGPFGERCGWGPILFGKMRLLVVVGAAIMRH